MLGSAMSESSSNPGAVVAVVDDERFDAHQDESGAHPECPERLYAAREGLHAALDPSRRMVVPAREALDSELARVHEPNYLSRLDKHLHRGSGNLDPDTYFNKSTREAAWLAAGGVIDLTTTLLNGSARRGVALLRPPGHHAVASSSMGFCLLNNVAVAASAALASGLSRVAIVDWDVHHGNGTQAMFYDDPRVLFVSLHQYPFYPGTGAPDEIGRGAGRGYTVNLALPAGSGPETYGAAFRAVVLPVLQAFHPELVLVSAGFDAHERDPLASMNLDQTSYAALASALLEIVDAEGHGRIAFILEGGYDLGALSESMRAVGQTLGGARTELPSGTLRAGQRTAIEASRRELAKYWQLTAAG
jgi:acetoin utilization deacetylase AcuC-like enzyme